MWTSYISLAPTWHYRHSILLKYTYINNQDDLTRPITLTGQLNCDRDALAKEIALDQMTSNRHIPIYTTYEGLRTVICDGKLITSHFQTSAYNHIQKYKFWKYLSTDNEDLTFLNNEVHLNSIRLARKEANFSIQSLSWYAKILQLVTSWYTEKRCSHQDAPDVMIIKKIETI